MDIGILVAIAMLVVWAIGALVYEAPGWIHLLLTIGVSLLIWRIVVRGDRTHPAPKKQGRGSTVEGREQTTSGTSR